MQELLLDYLLPIGLLVAVWLVLIMYQKQKRKKQRDRRKFGGRD
jgi:preprotein translocase subunit YajC